MDDKLFEEMDNLNERDTHQLLDSIDVKHLDEEIDKDATERIKSAVLQKAGIRDKKVKKPLIPKKTRLIAVSLVMSIIELLFFTSAAFVAWMDGFLGNSGVNLSFGGIIPTIFYIIMLGVMALSLYKVMFHIDSEKYTIDMILPKSRTSVIYSVYFIFSTAARILLFLAYIFVMEKIDELLYYRSEFPLVLSSLALFIVSLAVVDMSLSKLKNRIILRCEGIYSFPSKWRLNIKSFLLEVLKYVGIIGYIIIVAVLSFINNNRVAAFVVGFALLMVLNIFMILVVQLKKRNSLKFESINEKASDENKANEKAEMESVNRPLFFRHRALILGFSAAAGIYLFCIIVPYIVYPGLAPNKPLMETFSNKDEVNNFFVNQKLPFSTISKNAEVGDFTQALFMFNRFIVGTVTFKSDMLFAGVVASSSKAFDNGRLYGGAPGGESSTQAVSEHSTTNTQVESVDEADIIKTDGKYIYYLDGSDLYIVESYPTDKMKNIYRYDFSQEGLFPLELFLYQEHIAVILTDYGENEVERGYSRYSPSTVVKTYNINNPANPTLERSFRLDYPYLTSRMVENNLYLVATGYLNYSNSSPTYMDSSIGDFSSEVNYKDIFLMRGNISEDYRQINVVAALPIDKPYSNAQVKAYIGGGGETVYVSTEHIYIVESNSSAITEASVEEFFGCLTDERVRELDFLKIGTSIYRIEIQDGNIGDFDSAFVPGTVHNQFSMDEYDGYFRITTQKGRWQYASSSVYVLDGDMNVCGSLEGLAPEESIFASRFMGDRLYLVTFKVVDPLFVISLKDPKKPTVLGELKIPGYSEYIHPLDENHIIGFGKDTAGGNENFSWYQGIKMAIFDVSDVNNPKEKFVEIIGDRGTDSELLRNHKALMHMKNLGLLAFPVKLYDKKDNRAEYENGEFSYQGAYVYNISSDEGFKLRGRITHIDADSDIDFRDMYGNEDTSFVKRIIYANESLYTFSGEKVKATRYSDMKDVCEILLK